MRNLFAEKKVVLAGPYNDHTGGQAILNVRSANEAEDIVRHDPAVIDGVLTATVRPWATGVYREARALRR